MGYKVEDWYSPEAKRQVEVMDALQGQADLRYRRHVLSAPDMASLTEWQKGYREAYYGITHTLGEMSAHLGMEERARRRAALGEKSE